MISRCTVAGADVTAFVGDTNRIIVITPLKARMALGGPRRSRET